MKENRFLTKFKEKTIAELQDIVDDKKGYQPEARNAAIQILKERDNILISEESGLDTENKPKKYDFKEFEASIKKEHRFGWTPKFEETFRVELNKTVFIPIITEVFETLDWPVIFKDENSVEAIYINSWGKHTEKIEVLFEHDKVTIKSISLRSGFWDMGRNSKRVKLFIHAFKIVMHEYDQESLNKLQIETEKINNWDDYEIPKILPKPKENKKPNVLIPIAGGVISALLLGFIIALTSTEGIYFIGLFEVGVAFILGFIFASLIKQSNYTNYKNLQLIFIATVLVTYIANQYFQYQIILYKNSGISISFVQFLEFRIEAGLSIKNLELGSIGLILSWVFQLVATYYIGMLRLTLALTSYELERVPGEVLEFAIYHFVKGKSKQEVRYELSKMGWSKKDHQDDVLKSLDAMHDLNEYDRAV